MGQYTSRISTPSGQSSSDQQPQHQREQQTHQLPLPPTSAPPAATTAASIRPQQSVRRRRSSSNTLSSLPPSRRRRLLPLRFWPRSGSSTHSPSSDTHPTTSGTSAHSPSAVRSNVSSATFRNTTRDRPQSALTNLNDLVGNSDQAQPPLEDRFMDEMDSIAQNLSATLRNLQQEPAPAGSSTRPSSDLSANGPISFEHQTVMLSRLLEVAATSTVLTLMGNSNANGRRFDNSSRNGEDNSDSTFQDFITALRDGLLTQELSRNYNDANADNMTFFRAFRFDNDTTPRSQDGSSSGVSSTTNSGASSSPPATTVSSTADTPPPPVRTNDTPSVPVMIVGVRSVQPGPDMTANGPMQDDVDWFVRGGPSRSTQSRQEVRPEGTATENGSATVSPTDAPHPTGQGSDSAAARGTQRSWVIFVMGNSFSWNHPLLSAPSLMNENPTYEDLLNLQELIGQVKPQVATEEELNKHDDQLFEMDLVCDGTFVANSSHAVLKSDGLAERCHICLGNYENHDVVRKLDSCHHFYHRECIDTWLLKGKNNCPLCRSRGVAAMKEEEQAPELTPLL